MHLAAQYLAAAGISFLDRAPDDSNANLGFSTQDRCLCTHLLSENKDQLCLDYERFFLEWKNSRETTSFNLDGATHAEVVQWLSDTATTHLDKKYHYKLNYEIPHTVGDSFTYRLSDSGKLKELLQLRILGQGVIEKIDKRYALDTPIRVWPHHFDTGIYCPLPKSDMKIGLGLAIPDSVCDQHYFYITGYKNDKVIQTTDLQKLSLGEWKSGNYTGAILNTNGIMESDGIAFFEEAIKILSGDLA